MCPFEIGFFTQKMSENNNLFIQVVERVSNLFLFISE